jgi:hypothetical protein
MIFKQYLIEKSIEFNKHFKGTYKGKDVVIFEPKDEFINKILVLERKDNTMWILDEYFDEVFLERKYTSIQSAKNIFSDFIKDTK